MAGHSKWSKIRHKKAANDAKKNKIFSKLSQKISVAAREGEDPELNFTLRLLIEKAKEASMPMENVERAIDKGAGNLEGEGRLEEVVYEGYGPDNVAMVITTLTDNNNRTLSDIRKVFSDNGGSLADSGSVLWNFDQKGQVMVRPAKKVKAEKYGAEDEVQQLDQEEVMLALMEIPGVTDILQVQEENDDGELIDYLEVRTDMKYLGKVRDEIRETEYIIESAELIWVPKNYKADSEFSTEKIESFLEKVEDMDDVQDVFMDVKV